MWDFITKMSDTAFFGTILQLLATGVVLYALPYIFKNLPLATQHFMDWAKARAGHMKSQYLAGVLQRLTDIVGQQVLMLENTAIEDLKAAALDGKITKDELIVALADLKTKALATVKQYASAQGLWELARHLFMGDESQLAKWLDHQLEAAVSKLPPSGLQTPKSPDSRAAMASARKQFP